MITSRADDARVAYARWLTSQGAAERAQLITLQLEIAQGLASGSAQGWVNSSRVERDARAILRKHLPAWKTDERHDTAFYYKGFPARVALAASASRADVGNRSRALPVEHVVLRGFAASSTAIYDELAARGVRALTIAGNHHAAATALAKHPLLQQLAWLRVHEPRLDRAFWDGIERAAPRALLYIDGDRGLSLEDHDDDGDTVTIEEATLKRPAWRCPYTTWGPRPTIARVLACADAIRDGKTKRPAPGLFSYEVSLSRDVDRPPKTFAEVVAPETWDPEKE